MEMTRIDQKQSPGEKAVTFFLWKKRKIIGISMRTKLHNDFDKQGIWSSIRCHKTMLFQEQQRLGETAHTTGLLPRMDTSLPERMGWSSEDGGCPPREGAAQAHVRSSSTGWTTVRLRAYGSGLEKRPVRATLQWGSVTDHPISVRKRTSLL